MRFNWEIRLSDVLHLILVLVALATAWSSFESGKVQMEDKIQAISSQHTALNEAQQQTVKSVEHINTRLSRIEGKLNIRDGEGE